MPNLLAVHVLVAMAWPTHEEQAKVLAWLKGHASSVDSKSPFVNISSSSRFSPDGLTAQESLALLGRIQLIRLIASGRIASV